MAITNPQNIRLNRQDDIEAIIGRPPGWTLRWGMTVVFLCTSVLLLIGWLVSYPDIVEAPVMLTTENPPIRVVAGASANIASLQTTNHSLVKKGDVMGYLNTPAEPKDVLHVESFLDQLSENDVSNYLSVQLPTGLQLGSLQSDFALFSKNFEAFQYFLQRDINFQKISNLRQQILEIEKLNRSLEKQILLFENEVALSRKSVQRDSILLQQNSLSEFEFEQILASYLAKSRQLENLRSVAARNQLEIRQLEATILDLQAMQSDEQNELVANIKSDIQSLQGKIDQWKETWLLIAPINGKVVFTNAWSEQQFVEAGEEMMAIVPQQSAGNIFAKALLQGHSSGKVKRGMEVNIRLTGYPYQEFGTLSGSVMHIASVPNQNAYEIHIELENGLQTSYGKTIEFRQEMDGVARIITNDRNLLLRILEKIKAAVEQ